MSEQVQEFFTTLATRRYEPQLHSIVGTVQWKIEGEGWWNVIINKGAITVNRDPCIPDSLLSCDKDTFLALAKGVQNPTTAFLQGKLELEGNLGLSHISQRIFQKQADQSVNVTSARKKS